MNSAKISTDIKCELGYICAHDDECSDIFIDTKEINMKFTRVALAVTTGFLLAACGNLSKVSSEGTAKLEDLVWPKVESVGVGHSDTQKGSWPNWDNVRLIERGMSKDQLYGLIGRPHFSAGLYGVREWDYLFHYRENGEQKTCQYKILFDKNYAAQSFFWYPNGCNGYSHYTLSVDTLFDFDKDTLTAEGQQVVADVAEKLKASNATEVQVTGFADRLGSAAYNLDLSKRRAATVGDALQSLGVTAVISTKGLGQAYPVKACKGERGQALIDCLAPNRRVEIKSSGQMVNPSPEAGVEGPSALYDKNYPYPPKKTIRQ